jgi:hypothetical protein
VARTSKARRLRKLALVTERGDLSADLLVVTLRNMGVEFLRLNLDLYPHEPVLSWSSESASLSIGLDGEEYASKQFSSAWYRRLPAVTAPPEPAPEPWVGDFIMSERRRLLEGIWHATDWFWVNHPDAVRRAENKLVQLRRAGECAFRLPKTLVTSDPLKAASFVACQPSIAKALSTASVAARDTRFALFTRMVQPSDVEQSAAIEVAPVIFQELIQPKVDVRVTVVGAHVFATAIHLHGEGSQVVDWRSVDDSKVSYVETTVPSDVVEACKRMMLQFGLVYGAFDLVVSDGSWYFLELNPSGQWGWIEKATGQPITQALSTTLIEQAED